MVHCMRTEFLGQLPLEVPQELRNGAKSGAQLFVQICFIICLSYDFQICVHPLSGGPVHTATFENICKYLGGSSPSRLNTLMTTRAGGSPPAPKSIAKPNTTLLMVSMLPAGTIILICRLGHDCRNPRGRAVLRY